MELKYHTPTDKGGLAQYNGNISEIIWRSADSDKQSYGYYYDAMSRLKEGKYFNLTQPSKNSIYNEKIVNPTDNSWNASGYDLNGNILALLRQGKKDATPSPFGLMDKLTYTYVGNQVTRIDDAVANVDTEEGFKENTKEDGEYEYDANGNMVKDANKGITAITYNHLNLPLKVSKSSTEYIVYTYDVTGRKLKQQVYGSQSKTTDYLGEFLYENNTLQFITHDEGRVIMTASQPEYQYNLTDHLGNVRLTFTTQEDVESARATLELANTQAEQSKFLHHHEAVKVNFLLFDHTHEGTSGNPLIYNNDFSSHFNPFSKDGTITLGLTNGQLTVSGASKWNSASMSINTTPGYLYKVSFDIDLASGGRVDAFANANFQNLGIVSPITNGSYSYQFIANGTTALILFSNGSDGPRNFYLDNVKIENIPGSYAARLNGSSKEKIGLAKSLSVMPGDVINMEVFTKYVSQADKSNWTTLLKDFMTSVAFGTAPLGTVIDGGNPGSLGNLSFPFESTLTKANEPSSAPNAYLNFIVFDRDHNLIIEESGYIRVTEAAKENGTDVDHERLFKNLAITQPGYVYIYLSNDYNALGGVQADVFFDDFMVEHIKSPVVQTNDYYPFGLTFNSYERENSVDQKYKFQGQEHIDDLNLGWDSFKWRNYMPDIGRFFNVDPLASKYVYNSPYAFSENHVTSHVELEGLEKVSIHSASFAPFNTFGGPFLGDGANRKFSTDPQASSRIYGNVNLNLSGSGITQTGEANARGSVSVNLATGTASYSDAEMTSTMGGQYANGTSAMADVGFHLSGNNSQIPGSPDIDAKGQMQVGVVEMGENGSMATFSGAVTGDKFPANETYITDQNGTGVFLGVSGADGNPFTSLPGDNNRQMSQFIIGVKFDAQGNIQSVQHNGQTYSAEDWNKRFQNQNPQSGNTTTNNN
jgi:RHS repeat-associated protein